MYTLFYHERFYTAYSRRPMYTCMRIYVRVYVHILMYADIWTYDDNTNILRCAYVFVGVGGVSAILTLPPSLFIAFHFIHCIINLLCILILYICDWSTIDLTEEDEVNWTAVTGEYMGNNCWHQNRIKHRETDALLKLFNPLRPRDAYMQLGHYWFR